MDRFTERGLVVAGVEFEVDTIIFATGFELGVDPDTRAGVDIRGHGGQSLSEYWSDGLRTLHGWVSRGFPNFFHVGATQNAHSANRARPRGAGRAHRCGRRRG